jgi:hypothetical protein
MNSTEQKTLDQLYLFVTFQNIRSSKLKTQRERQLLMDFIGLYKKYYFNKAKEILARLEIDHQKCVNSLFTFDTKYYTQEYKQRKTEVEEYLLNLQSCDFQTDMSYISDEISLLFPNFILTPTLWSKPDVDV